MKKLFILLLLICLPVVVYAAFIFDEDFEGTGTPSGWFKGNSSDYDYTGFVLAGSESLRAAGSTGDYSFYDHTDTDEIWFKQLIRFDEIRDSGGAANPWIIQDSGYGGLANWYVFNDGSVTIDFVTYSSAGSLLEDTTYYLWGHYKKGTGGTWEIWWDTVDDRASAANHLSTSVSNTNQVSQHLICGAGSTDVIICDDVQLANTDEFAGGGGGGVVETIYEWILMLFE